MAGAALRARLPAHRPGAAGARRALRSPRPLRSGLDTVVRRHDLRPARLRAAGFRGPLLAPPAGHRRRPARARSPTHALRSGTQTGPGGFTLNSGTPETIAT